MRTEKLSLISEITLTPIDKTLLVNLIRNKVDDITPENFIFYGPKISGINSKEN